VDEPREIKKNLLTVGIPVGIRNRFLPNTIKPLPTAMRLAGKRLTVQMPEFINSIYLALPLCTVTTGMLTKYLNKNNILVKKASSKCK